MAQEPAAIPNTRRRQPCLDGPLPQDGVKAPWVFGSLLVHKRVLLPSGHYARTLENPRFF